MGGASEESEITSDEPSSRGPQENDLERDTYPCPHSPEGDSAANSCRKDAPTDEQGSVRWTPRSLGNQKRADRGDGRQDQQPLQAEPKPSGHGGVMGGMALA